MPNRRVSHTTSLATLLGSLCLVLGTGMSAGAEVSEERVQDLLSRMTLAEKIGQINMPCVYKRELGADVASKLAGCRKFTLGQSEPGIGPAGGFFTLADNALHEGPRQQARFFNELQTLATTQTRLKIPLLQIEEGTHGLMCSMGTIYPEGPGLGSTWNLDLIEQVYAATAREARAVGIHQLCTLVVEPIRDPRLGRNQEAYSEDPFLCAAITERIVRGTQGRDVASPEHVAAVLCHYPGQSQPVSGLERGAMEISERVLREVFLPPYVVGIRKCGALGVMATYPAIDGIPAHGSVEIMTNILRHELGFEGLVLGEGNGIETLVYERCRREPIAAVHRDTSRRVQSPSTVTCLRATDTGHTLHPTRPRPGGRRRVDSGRGGSGPGAA